MIRGGDTSFSSHTLALIQHADDSRALFFFSSSSFFSLHYFSWSENVKERQVSVPGILDIWDTTKFHSDVIYAGFQLDKGELLLFCATGMQDEYLLLIICMSDGVAPSVRVIHSQCCAFITHHSIFCLYSFSCVWLASHALVFWCMIWIIGDTLFLVGYLN